MIVLKNVSKSFRTPAGTVPALVGVNLHVRKGEVFGIIGLSGAGKSTLIRTMALLEQPDEGAVYLDGRDVTHLRGAALRAERRRLGMIFQHFNLLRSRTAAENVALPLEIAGVPRAQIRRRVAELLDLVGLGDRAGAYPSQLSGGQKQRVAIARALATDPAVLLSDEATSALDPQTTRSILALLRDLGRRLGLTIVLVTHEMDVIRQVCDRVAVMEGGRIVEEGPVLEVFSRPRSAVTRAFLEDLRGDGPLPAWVTVNGKPHPAGEDRRYVHVTFVGPTAAEPVISRMVRRFAVEANVLRGKVDQIGESPFGALTLELRGAPQDVARATEFLTDQGLIVEVLHHA
ncbi:methionine ABC transporter ATP-binding protein [Caldinitratiruptor microaerophilus]|uniref:methionine ABC transporter ATP-binding protein n=1 Tax=Caldinitratiruptor microaerophilus TaxID=671077 RepID=UPI00222EC7BF|nr:methionine ABC transporter ATP-binding protein [Caldinitratiruptor microaerophilus]